MGLKLYVDRMSQPSRAVLIFCKANQIDFEEVRIHLSKRQHKSPEFTKINPMGQVPAIADGELTLFESHAILRYLACAFPGVAEHWYPADLAMRAKIDSILDWHHSNLRRGGVGLVFNSVLAPAFGQPLNAEAAKKGEELIDSSFSLIESLWLEGDSKFLLGRSEPSIADLRLVCEITQLELIDEKEKERILEPHPKIRDWIANVKSATNPHFEEIHVILYKAKAMFQSA